MGRASSVWPRRQALMASRRGWLLIPSSANNEDDWAFYCMRGCGARLVKAKPIRDLITQAPTWSRKLEPRYRMVHGKYYRDSRHQRSEEVLRLRPKPRDAGGLHSGVVAIVCSKCGAENSVGNPQD